MDIFTTVLTKVVPTPIKSVNLKVKALVKDAETGKLSEDPDHLENHDSYYSLSKESSDNQSTSGKKHSPLQEKNETLTDVIDDDEGPPHLDIFI